MEWKDQVVAEIGKVMGVSDLEFGESGVVNITYDNGGVLSLEDSGSGVLLYYSDLLPSHGGSGLLVEALRWCHYKKRDSSYLLQVGLNGDLELYLCVFLRNEIFEFSKIQEVIKEMKGRFRILSEI